MMSESMYDSVKRTRTNSLPKYTVYINPPQPEMPGEGCYYLDFFTTHEAEEESLAAVRAAIRDYLSENPCKPIGDFMWGDTRLRDIPDDVWERHGLHRDYCNNNGEGGCEFFDWNDPVFEETIN